MTRFAVRLCLFLLSAVLLTGFLLPAARADGPTLSAVFGIAGHYRVGGWCPVMVTVQNPGADTISGQLQVLTAEGAGQSAYGRPVRTNAPSVVFACPVTVSGGSSTPQTFPVYLRGIDPGQADLTVQLVEGRERGDGHVLAQINTQNPNTSSAFTGAPVAANDQLLVGFGGDPGAFTFLNSRHFGTVISPVTGQSAAIQIAEAASASDLPGSAVGYDGVDAFLLRSDAPLDGLTGAQADALKGWVASGGHLIVCGGSDPSRFGSAFFDGLLPAAVNSNASSGALNLTPKPLPGVHVVSSAADGTPQIVSGPYGAGSITLTAYDPTAGALQTANTFVLPPVWQTLLADRRNLTSSVVGVAAAHEENYGAVNYGNTLPFLSEAVMRGPSLDAPGTWVIGVFLLIYLIVLVPVNYFVLKRLDRKEWAWATIPALVLVFAFGTFAVGYAAKGGSVFVNRAALIETTAGRQEAGVYAELGLFSPRRTTYDILLSGANMAAAIPNPGFSYGNRNGDEPVSGPAQFVQIPAGISMPGTPVNMWAMRSFDTQSTVDLGGAIDGSVTAKNGVLTGSIVNHTSYALTDCTLLSGGRWISLGTLAPGANMPVNAASGPSPLGLTALPSPGVAGSDLRNQMQTALADYCRSLGQPNHGYSGYSLPVYASAPGEALLVGWSSDPKLAGPAPQVDGRSVTENDVSLVIVPCSRGGEVGLLKTNMGILTDNPVLRREVRGRLRFKSKGGLLAHRWIAWLVGLMIVYYYARGLAGIWRGTAQDARGLWPLLIYGTLALIVLLAPALAATAITQEREQQTWEILAVTQLSGTEVLLGKWIGRQIIPWLLIVILLPFLAVTVLRADLGGWMLPAVLCFLLVTTGFYSALGLLCSFQARRTVTATASALTVTALLCVGTVIVNGVLAYLQPSGLTGDRADSFAMWLNPFNVLGLLLDKITPEYGSVISPDNGLNTDIIRVYFTAALLGAAAALGFMVRRYGRSA